MASFLLLYFYTFYGLGDFSALFTEPAQPLHILRSTLSECVRLSYAVLSPSS
jgi:hypothetical protein